MPRIPADDSIDSSNTTSGDESSDNSSETDSQTTTEDVRRAREDEITDGRSTEPAADADLSPGFGGGQRRTDSTNSSGDDAGAGSSGGGSVPDDINQGRRQSSSDDDQKTGATDQGGTETQTGAEKAAAQEQRDAIASKGTTGRALLDRQIARQAGVDRSDVDVQVTEDSVDVSRTASGTERAQKRAEAELSEDVQTSQFAQRRLREQVASNSSEFESSDVDVDASDGTLTIGLTEGGRAREAVETAAENSEYSESELTASAGEDGAFSVSVKEEALVERAASNNPDLQESDLQVVEQERADFSGQGRSATTDRTVELTDEARNDRIRDQVASERAGVEADDVSLQFGDDGDVTGANVNENFDDGGRFLGVGGAEDDVERVVEGVGEFTGGVGEAVGTAIGGTAQVGANVTGLSPEGQNEIYEFSADVGRRVGTSLNVTQALTAADELGEFAGGATARTLSGEGGAVLEDTIESGQRITGPIVKDFESNPARATAGVVGSVAVTGGAFKAAQGTRAGPLARATLQPGEEAFAAATGVRVGAAARRGAAGAASRVRGINTPELPSGVGSGVDTLRDAASRRPRIDVVENGSSRLEVSDNFGSGPSTGGATPNRFRVPGSGRVAGARERVEARASSVRRQASIENLRARLEADASVRQRVSERVGELQSPQEIASSVRGSVTNRLEGALESARDAEARSFERSRDLLYGDAGPELDAPTAQNAITNRLQTVRDRTSGGVQSARLTEATAFNRSRSLLYGDAGPELGGGSGRNSVANRLQNVRDRTSDAVQSARLTEATAFNRSRSLLYGDAGPELESASLRSQASAGLQGVQDRVGDAVQSARLAEAASFSRSRSLLYGDSGPNVSDSTSLPSSAQTLVDVARGESTVRISPGKPGRRVTPDADVSDSDVVVVDTRTANTEADQDLFGATESQTGNASNDARTDIESESGAEGSGQVAVMRSEMDTSRTGTGTDSTRRQNELGVSGPEFDEADISIDEGVSEGVRQPQGATQSPEVTSFAESVRQPDVEAPELGVDTGAGVTQDQEPASVVEPETGTKAENEVGVESEVGSETDTRVDTDSAVDSRSEVEAQLALETEAGSENERELPDFGTSSRRRRFRGLGDDGDEQRFDFGDIELL